MARYKSIDTNPRLLAVDLAAQLVPGTFEHAVQHLMTQELDLSLFDGRFRNDVTGATAYPPAMLLAVVLCAYARGIVSSRAIARACEEQSPSSPSAGTRGRTSPRSPTSSVPRIARSPPCSRRCWPCATGKD